jgi:hypothetical protein
MKPNRIALRTFARKMRSNQLLLLLQFAKEACLALGLSNEVGRIDDAWHDITKSQELRAQKQVISSSDGTDMLQTFVMIGQSSFLGRIKVSGGGVLGNCPNWRLPFQTHL